MPNITSSGEGGIRTLGTCYRTRHFQCRTFGLSVTSPLIESLVTLFFRSQIPVQGIPEIVAVEGMALCIRVAPSLRPARQSGNAPFPFRGEVPRSIEICFSQPECRGTESREVRHRSESQSVEGLDLRIDGIRGTVASRLQAGNIVRHHVQVVLRDKVDWKRDRLSSASFKSPC